METGARVMIASSLASGWYVRQEPEELVRRLEELYDGEDIPASYADAGETVFRVMTENDPAFLDLPEPPVEPQ